MPALLKNRDETINLLEDIARILELKGESVFKVRAYANGARTLETFTGDFEELIASQSLSSLPGMGDALKEAFKAVFNAIAGFWNDTVGKLSFKVPSWVPIIGGKKFDVPDIPTLAEGGIVTGPTLALIGEAGPEAVIPLNRMNQGVTVNIAGSVISERDLIETIRRGLVNSQRNGAQLVYSNT